VVGLQAADSEALQCVDGISKMRAEQLRETLP